MHYFTHCRTIIICFLLVSLGANASTLNIDSLNYEIELVKSDNKKGNLLDLYLSAADFYEEDRSYEKAIEYYGIALTFLTAEKDLTRKGKVLFSISYCHLQLGHFRKVIEINLEVLDIDDQYLEGHLKAKSLNKISSAYRSLGDFLLAYDFQQQSLKIREELNDSTGIALSMYEFGTIFFYQERFDQSLEHYRKANEMYEKLDRPKNVYSCLAAIGSIYDHLGDVNLSLKYGMKALQKAEELEYKLGIAYAKHNVGCSYIQHGQYDVALNYLNESLKLKVELRDKWGAISTYRAIADAYVESNRPKKALKPLMTALEHAQESDAKPKIIEIYKYIAKAYSKLEDYKTSNEYLYKYTLLKDEMINETSLREMGQKKASYEMEKKENEIKLLKKKKEILEKEQQIEGLYNYILIGAAIFLLILLRLMYSRYSHHRESNRLLEEKNAEIKSHTKQLEEANRKQLMTNLLLEEKNQLMEDQNEQINFQNEKLESSNEDLKQFAYVASHDLKEPLRMINAYTSLLKKRYSDLFDDNAQEFMGFIIDAVNRMDTLLTDLLTYSRANTREGEHQWLEARDILDITAANLRHSIESQNAKLIYSDSLPQVMVNKSQMLQLFQNLIANAIKFRKPDVDPEVTINCEKKDTHFLFSIKDNGIGMAPENQEKVFEVFRRLHSQSEYEGSGIGLATCKKIVEKHRGKIWVESVEGEGSTFFFTIYLPKAENPNEEGSNATAEQKEVVAA